MNIETKAGHEAMSLSERSGAQRQTSGYDSSKDKLVADLKLLVADTEQLAKEAANASNEGFTALRAQFDAKLVDARAKLVEAKTAVGEKARRATDTAHAYVRQNPWRTAGAFAAVGAIVGLLAGWRARR
jgi:ElaB/YqjD/DUF883 family membrane-anchored ribosome-binding protein